MFNRRSFCSIFTLHPRMAAYTCSSTLGFAHLLKPVAHGARRLTDGVRGPRPDVLGGFWGDPRGVGWANLNLGPGAGAARQLACSLLVVLEIENSVWLPERYTKEIRATQFLRDAGKAIGSQQLRANGMPEIDNLGRKE